MPMLSDAELERLYAEGNAVSRSHALRAVYKAGVADGKALSQAAAPGGYLQSLFTIPATPAEGAAEPVVPAAKPKTPAKRRRR